MNSSSSPGGRRKRPWAKSPARQAALAASIRSLRRGDEVPPDVARAAQRLPAEQQQPRALGPGAHRHPVARAEHHHLVALEALPGHLDRPLRHVEPAVLVVVRQRDQRPGRQRGVGIEHLAERSHRRPLAERVPEDQPQLDALGLQHRQVRLRRVLEAGRRVLGGLRQRHPGLDAEDRMRMRPRLRRGAFRMGDAAPGVIQFTSPGESAGPNPANRGAGTRPGTGT